MARRHLLLLITAIVFTTWLPYIFGWWLTPPETRYLWLIYSYPYRQLRVHCFRGSLGATRCLEKSEVGRKGMGTFVGLDNRHHRLNLLACQFPAEDD